MWWIVLIGSVLLLIRRRPVRPRLSAAKVQDIDALYAFLERRRLIVGDARTPTTCGRS
jgi:hypothetical protein